MRKAMIDTEGTDVSEEGGGATSPSGKGEDGVMSPKRNKKLEEIERKKRQELGINEDEHLKEPAHGGVVVNLDNVLYGIVEMLFVPQ